MTETSSKAPGYSNLVGTRLAYEFLASGVYDTIPVSIDVSSRDWSNPDGSTHLRPGLALGYDTSSGRYKPFKASLHSDATIVILFEEVRDIDSVSVQVPSFAIYRGVFKTGGIIEPEAVTWSEVQRISIRDNA